MKKLETAELKRLENCLEDEQEKQFTRDQEIKKLWKQHEALGASSEGLKKNIAASTKRFRKAVNKVKNANGALWTIMNADKLRDVERCISSFRGSAGMRYDKREAHHRKKDPLQELIVAVNSGKGQDGVVKLDGLEETAKEIKGEMKILSELISAGMCRWMWAKRQRKWLENYYRKVKDNLESMDLDDVPGYLKSIKGSFSVTKGGAASDELNTSSSSIKKSEVVSM